jgi:hypothetical protein
MKAQSRKQRITVDEVEAIITLVILFSENWKYSMLGGNVSTVGDHL